MNKVIESVQDTNESSVDKDPITQGQKAEIGGQRPRFNTNR